MLYLAHDVQAPILRLLGLISQALERDPDLDLVPPLGEPPAGLEHVIGAEVGSLTTDEGTADESARRNVGSFDKRAVSLYAQRIYREHQRLLPIVERAEQDLHVVVAEDLVAVGERGGRPAVPVGRADPEVDRGGGGPDEHLCRIRGGNAVVR